VSLFYAVLQHTEEVVRLLCQQIFIINLLSAINVKFLNEL